MKKFINPIKKTILILTISTLTLSACSPSLFEKKVEETEKENKKIQPSQEELEKLENPEKQAPNEVEVTEKQKETLEQIEDKQTPEEAVKQNVLDNRAEIEKITPVEKDIYTDVEEFGQYVSYLFYQYHTSQITGKEFYEKLSPHFSANFNSLLPSGKQEQIETFEVLQSMFLQHLDAPIIDYQITNVEQRSRVEEAGMYRKYLTKNNEPIYYESVFIKEGEKWLLFDDSPSPPYVIDPQIESKFNQVEGK